MPSVYRDEERGGFHGPLRGAARGQSLGSGGTREDPRLCDPGFGEEETTLPLNDESSRPERDTAPGATGNHFGVCERVLLRTKTSYVDVSPGTSFVSSVSSMVLHYVA